MNTKTANLPHGVGTQIESTIRWCEDIGMYAYDRSIPESCIHATAFCKTNCYNDKLYKIYPAMHGKDVKNEAYWAEIDGARVARDLSRKRKQTARVRLMTRGEAFSTFNDVERVRNIATHNLTTNPETLFWIPTRGWRNPLLRVQIERLVSEFENLRILASMDPTNTAEEWADLKASGWSTMFFGDDAMRTTPAGDKMFLCPKTHGHVKGACAVCKRGCFRADKRVDVHLSQH